MALLSFSSLKYFFFGYSGLLEDEKTTFLSQLEVLTSLGIPHVDKVASTGQLQVLSKNRYVKFFFAETNFFNALEASRSR